MNENFKVLLFAGDINVYSVARAFHQAYGMKVDAYGKFNSMPCAGSNIINYSANPNADKQDTFLELAIGFAQKHKEKKVILIGCGDSYVQLISENKDKLPNNVIAPYINIDLMNELIHKEKFYAMCETVGVDYPNTYVHKKDIGHYFELPFEAPFIVKPSNGIEYWRHPFDTQKKVYKADTRKELDEILDDIYSSGYEDSIIIQDFIPGDDTYMRVLTAYSDRNRKVKMMCLGHVLLEEHTPHGIGNHAVIITEHNEEVEQQFKTLLDNLKYIGFSNFDIKYDQRDGKYKVFEINTRQGRSNFYVTGAGANIGEYLVRDYILEEDLQLKIVKDKHLWMMVPKKVAFDFIKPQIYKDEMKKLIKVGKYVNPLWYREDNGIIRQLKLVKSQMGHHYKFKKYLGK